MKASFNSITDWENEQFSRVSPENPRATVDAEASPNLQLNTAKLDGQPPAPGDRLRIHCEFVHVLHLGKTVVDIIVVRIRIVRRFSKPDVVIDTWEKGE